MNWVLGGMEGEGINNPVLRILNSDRDTLKIRGDIGGHSQKPQT